MPTTKACHYSHFLDLSDGHAGRGLDLHFLQAAAPHAGSLAAQGAVELNQVQSLVVCDVHHEGACRPAALACQAVGICPQHKLTIKLVSVCDTN